MPRFRRFRAGITMGRDKSDTEVARGGASNLATPLLLSDTIVAQKRDWCIFLFDCCSIITARRTLGRYIKIW